MGYGQYSYNSFNPKSLKDFRSGTPQDRVTGKRVKGVFDTRQTIHVWAQRTQTFGKNGKGNVFFEGDRLFDYGYHFCMAQFVTNDNGEVACLVNSGSYGPTTSHHQSVTRGAIPPGIPVFSIPGAGYDGRYSNNLDLPGIMENYKTRIIAAAGTAKRARKQYTIDYNSAQAARLVDEADALARFFGVKVPKFGIDDLIAEAKANAERAAKAEAKRLEADRIESADQYAKWKAGAIDYCPHSWSRDERGGVRMRIKGDILQTALGAEVPLRHAVKVFRFVKQCKETGTAWHRNGTTVRVGHFQVDSVEPNGDFKAGCHSFTWEGVEAAAKAAGVFDLAAADARESSAQAA